MEKSRNSHGKVMGKTGDSHITNNKLHRIFTLFKFNENYLKYDTDNEPKTVCPELPQFRNKIGIRGVGIRLGNRHLR